MGPDAAVNAVFYNRIQETPEAERAALVQQLREEYRAELDLSRLASENIVDDVVEPVQLRTALLERFALIRSRPADARPAKKHAVAPV